MHAAAAADTVVLARSSTVPVVPVILYRYMYTSSGARATFRHHARAEEALQYSSLIATEELTELLKPVVPCPSNIFRCDTRPAKPLDLCLVDLYQNPDLLPYMYGAWEVREDYWTKVYSIRKLCTQPTQRQPIKRSQP